mgnify:CR=1 FL=1
MRRQGNGRENKRSAVSRAVRREGEARHNAPTGSGFNRFKNERAHGVRYTTHADMKAASFEYIEVFYNRTRQHSTLGDKSPRSFPGELDQSKTSGKAGSLNPSLGKGKTEGSPVYSRPRSAKDSGGASAATMK